QTSRCQRDSIQNTPSRHICRPASGGSAARIRLPRPMRHNPATGRVSENQSNDTLPINAKNCERWDLLSKVKFKRYFAFLFQGLRKRLEHSCDKCVEEDLRAHPLVSCHIAQCECGKCVDLPCPVGDVVCAGLYLLQLIAWNPIQICYQGLELT